MNRRPSSLLVSLHGYIFRLAGAAAAIACAAGLSGCVVATVVGAVGTVAVATVSTVGKVAVTTVKAAGNVAASAVSGSGEDSGVEVAAKLSQKGMVVFFDPKTGAVWKTPWAEGLQLFAASQTAQVSRALRAARVIRNAQVLAIENGKMSDLVLKSGDVIELASVPGS